eukprot:PhF_6_TR32163/c0_g2_i3/m.47711/K00873/PK, pyk; pyruvate kinase
MSKTIVRGNRFISSLLEYNTKLNLNTPVPSHYPHTKIVCTIGPSSQSVATLEGMIQNGMNVARLNFSHGSHEYHAASIVNIRKAAENQNAIVGIALDTKGAEIRTGPGVRQYQAGDNVILTAGRGIIDIEEGGPGMMLIDYEQLIEKVPVGGTILIADGTLELRMVEKLSPHTAVCKVICGARVSGRNNVHLPGVDVELPAVSAQDALDIAFGLSQGIDMIFASFVRSAQNVEEIRNHLRKGNREDVAIIAKIENYKGVENIDEIVGAADGVMVARGDLGVEIPLEKIFIAQKLLIAKCNLAAKPVICATQMLESMTSNPRPTRAEATDVANAVLDGADAVMLSAESASGSYPRESVETLSKITSQAQGYVRYMKRFRDVLQLQKENEEISAVESVAASAVLAALERQAKCVVTATTTGNSVRQLCKYYPPCPIIAVCSTPECSRRLSLVRGVIPLYCSNVNP